MKKIIETLCVLIAVLAFASCQEDEMEKTVREGLPCSLTLSISVPEAGEAVMTKATDAQETSVEKVALLFYKKSQPDEVPVVVEITGLDKIEPEKVSETNYKYTVTVQTDELYSGEWYLYAVANYDKNYIPVDLDKLKSMTKSQIDDFCVTGSSELDFVESGVLLSGKYEQEDKDGKLTLTEGGNNLDGELVLRRLISKSIFVFKNGSGVTFIPESYELHNYSISSTLMERTGWVDKNGKELEEKSSTTRGTHPGNLTYKAASSTSPLLLKQSYIPITQKDGENYTFFFYTQENVQGSSDITSYNLREERNNGSRDFKNAPENATYVVVKGRYSGPGENTDEIVTGNVEYTIHLGDFSQSTGSNGNFTIRRNTKYTYNVTVNGVNSIIVEAKQEDLDGGYQHGAEGDIMKLNEKNSVRLDAHYEQVLLSLDLADFPMSSFSLVIKTPYTDKEINSVDDFSDDDDLDWIKFGKPASSSTFQKYGDVRGTLGTIKDLVTELSELSSSQSSYKYCLVENGKIYIAAYVNEYYYDDKTDNANLAKYINADDREMRWATSVNTSDDKHSTYTATPIFSIAQRSIKAAMNLTLDNPFGIETVEETPETKLDPSYSGSENGDRNLSTGTDCNGWLNMSSLVGKKWSEFVNEATNGYINGTLDKTNIMVSSTGYAVYQMLSRNRDLNGDNTIDEEELRWFLPSRNQYATLWYGYGSLVMEARLGGCSTYVTSSNGGERIWWRNHGVSFNTNNPNNNVAVRTIRNLKNYNAASSEVSYYDSANRIVTVSGIDEALNMRTYLMQGDYLPHKIGDESDKLPKAFKISKNYVTLTGYTASQVSNNTDVAGEYYEEEDKSDLGLWRVPNEKEFGMICQYLGLTNIPNCTMMRTVDSNGRSYFRWANYCVTSSSSSKIYVPIVTSDDRKLEYASPQNERTGTKGTFVPIVYYVRDVEPVSGNNTNASESSYVNGGIGVR